MEECLAIKPDLIFLWDEAVVWVSRAGRRCLRPGARAWARPPALEEWKATPRGLGGVPGAGHRVGARTLIPRTARLLKRRLVPDPRKMRVRVYQTTIGAQIHVVPAAGVDRGGAGRGLRSPRLRPSARRFSSMPRPPPMRRSSHRWTSPGVRWSSRATKLVMRGDRDLAQYPPRNRRPPHHLEILPRTRRRRHGFPAEFRASGFKDFPGPPAPTGWWRQGKKAMQEDEFFLDPTRMTARLRHRRFYDGTAFKKPAGVEIQRSAQQDVAQQRAAPEQHQ